MKKILAIASLIFSMVFISCDQDFNTIGADLVGDEHFDFNKYEVQGLKAYSVETGEVQTNNLPINPIGFYKNPYFGQTSANFVTQVSMVTPQPKFGTNVEIEKVTLYVPYFSTAGTKDSDGKTEYTLDSIFGANKESKIKLSVYENGYFINSFDPNTDYQDAQRYYSNGTSNGSLDPINFDGLKIGNDGSNNAAQGGTRLNNSTDDAENDQFFFNKEEIVTYKTKFNTVTLVQEYVDADGNVLQGADQTDPTKWVVKDRLAPGIYLTLDKAYFKKRILETSASNLVNNNAFRQYFKGLYFKTEQVAGQEGAMAMLNFNKATINLYYSSISEGTVAATSKVFVMNLGTNAGANTVSLQNFTPTSTYSTALSANLNQTIGQNANLFLKGGKGSVVYMNVFGDADDFKIENGQLVAGSNSVPDELDQLRLNKWLINDAYLEFYIDRTAMAGANQVEAERLYLFDATNQKPIADYTFDSTTGSNSKRNKVRFGGMIERDDTADEKGIKYKIRVTQHITNILNSSNVNVNKNVKLGLCVTENIGLTSNYNFKSPIDFVSPSDPNIENFPEASVMSQEGVVLHGTGSADVEKRLRLVIHYTKPN